MKATWNPEFHLGFQEHAADMKLVWNLEFRVEGIKPAVGNDVYYNQGFLSYCQSNYAHILDYNKTTIAKTSAYKTIRPADVCIVDYDVYYDSNYVCVVDHDSNYVCVVDYDSNYFCVVDYDVDYNSNYVCVLDYDVYYDSNYVCVVDHDGNYFRVVDYDGNYVCVVDLHTGLMPSM
ncbi:hypothetical protein AURDEDRAFT_132063 [Auricularia subglabra TFB-10046 SS5]|uniref:Uncharacterized protein n=1 Tax=Auricularia subglabra (strain TFB-10046 / SS5) TaxID=717982 RepID=J0CQY0_AURST|nr:hypothetical protein AURDEDRAFT_132063 [Auricularia subglabra TFB-10046 SS5]